MLKLIKKTLLFPVFKRKVNYSSLNPKNWKKVSIKKFFKKLFRFFFFSIVTIAAVFIIDDYLYWNYDYSLFYGDMSYSADEYYEHDSECNVIGVEIYGTLATYIDENISEIQSSSYDLSHFITTADKDDSIKAIIIEIDSYGGYPVAGEEVSLALKRAEKPTVAVIREGGLSAAYLAASGADKIFASKSSDVGSIGVTMSYLNYSEQNKREGINYISLSSGKFKDYGNPDKEITAEERNLFMRDINILHKNFVELVAENRGLPIEKIEALADGSSMLGEMALENGLIDYIGGFYEAEKYLSDLIGEKIDICWE